MPEPFAPDSALIHENLKQVQIKNRRRK
jgi:hypothetical protein